jgi:hypothetical protein
MPLEGSTRVVLAVYKMGLPSNFATLLQSNLVRFSPSHTSLPDFRP